jgi:hypothetical protein
LKTRPADGRCSAGELVGHLSALERISRTEKLPEKPPISRPFFRRFPVPMMLVEARVVRRKAPIALEPQMLREKDAMLGEIAGSARADAT